MFPTAKGSASFGWIWEREERWGFLSPGSPWEEWESLQFPGEYFCKLLPGKAADLVSQEASQVSTQRPPPLLYRLGLCHKLMFPMIQEEISLLAKRGGSGAKWPGFTAAP